MIYVFKADDKTRDHYHKHVFHTVGARQHIFKDDKHVPNITSGNSLNSYKIVFRVNGVLYLTQCFSNVPKRENSNKYQTNINLVTVAAKEQVQFDVSGILDLSHFSSSQGLNTTFPGTFSRKKCLFSFPLPACKNLCHYFSVILQK